LIHTPAVPVKIVSAHAWLRARSTRMKSVVSYRVRHGSGKSFGRRGVARSRTAGV
jgi:hypothetical protein